MSNATLDANTRNSPFKTCPGCGDHNPAEATSCKACAHAFEVSTPSDLTKEQRIKDFSDWHQVVLAGRPGAGTKRRRARQPRRLVTVGGAVALVAVLMYLLLQLFLR